MQYYYIPEAVCGGGCEVGGRGEAVRCCDGDVDRPRVAVVARLPPPPAGRVELVAAVAATAAAATAVLSPLVLVVP